MTLNTNVALASVKCIPQHAELTDNKADDFCCTQESTALNIKIFMELGW